MVLTPERVRSILSQRANEVLSSWLIHPSEEEKALLKGLLTLVSSPAPEDLSVINRLIFLAQQVGDDDEGHRCNSPRPCDLQSEQVSDR